MATGGKIEGACQLAVEAAAEQVEQIGVANVKEVRKAG
jgi:hypothetical protein